MTKHIYVNETINYIDSGKIIKGRGLCYHISAEWLSGAGNDAKKAKCVEIYQVTDYLDWHSS
jgi:hypothetical protein